MIDVHSHILPGLDDGAGTLEESVEMVRMAQAAGTTDIVASPHANIEYEFVQEVVEAKIAEVGAAAGEGIRIHYGCDFHLTMENIADALAHPGKYAIGHRCYLLVEFADIAIPKFTTDIFGEMIAAGIRPVVTHPERNPLLQRRLPELEIWVGMGCLLQVTALSFSGRFGRAAEAFSRELMGRGLVHVIASDAHDTRHRPPVLDGTFQHISREYGEETAVATMLENPRAVISGTPLPPGPMPAPRRKKWYQRLAPRA